MTDAGDTTATSEQPSSGQSAPAPPTDESPAAADGAPSVMRHGTDQPPVEGGIWTAPAISERPGHVTPAPEGWENPPSVERHGPAQPPEQPIWTPSHGGTSSPYDLGRTEDTAPEGYENPPSRELHGPGPGA